MATLFDDRFDDSTGSGPESRSFAVSRRALFGTVFGGVTTVALLESIGDRFGSAEREPEAVGSVSLSQSTADDLAATPLAGPEGSPEAVDVPEQLGSLTVYRGEAFTYDETPVRSDILQMMIQSSPDSLNFNPASFRQDFQITASYLDPLLWIDDETMEPRPWLAESWEWDENSRTITFTLRDDVRWHDGDRFQARDVAFSFEVYRDDLDSGARNLFTQMESVEAIDPRTVAVTLISPDGNWLLNAATQPMFKRSQYIEHWNAKPVGQRTLSDFSWITESPVGTGPWKIGRRRSVRIECDRNAEYFAGPPQFEQLFLNLTANQEERVAKWNAGESDILANVSVADLPALQDTPGKLYVSNGVRVMFAAFNFANLSRPLPGLLQDIRIRRALSLAINRDRYVDDQFMGFTRGYAAGTVAQPWAHDEGSVSPQQDLDEAIRLLAEAGLTDLNNDGLLEDLNGSPLTFSAIVRDDFDPLLIQLLEELSGDFRQLGVQFQLKVLSADDFYESWTRLRDYDFIAYSYALYPGFTDYDLYGSNFDIRINPQGWNPGGYNNEDVDSFIRRILITTDPERQRDVLGRLQQTVNDDLFGLWFGFPDDLVVTRENLFGYSPNKYLTTWNTRNLWRRSF